MPRSSRHRPRSVRPACRVGHERHRCSRQLLCPLSSSTVPSGDRPRHDRARGAGRRLDLGGDHRGDRSTYPPVHFFGRCIDQSPDGAPGEASPPPGRPLSGRRRRPPDPEGLRSGQGPGGRGPRHHRSVPLRHHGHAEGGVPFVARPRAAGNLLSGSGGRGRRSPAARWPSEPGYRPVRPHPGPRGVPTAPAPRDELSRQCRRNEGGRGSLLLSGATGAPPGHRHRCA